MTKERQRKRKKGNRRKVMNEKNNEFGEGKEEN